jgi:hypothetical protein
MYFFPRARPGAHFVQSKTLRELGEVHVQLLLDLSDLHAQQIHVQGRIVMCFIYTV